MSVNNVGEGYIFIIDTEQYAGNFEREMCAYVTGCIGECGVGAEGLCKFAEDMGLEIDERGGIINNPFDKIIRNVSNEGCYRPCSIWETPGWFNDGYGNHFRDGEEDKAKESYRKCAIMIKTQELERTKSIVPVEDTEENRKRGAWTIDAIDAHIKWLENEIQELKGEIKLRLRPQFQSVAIFFNKCPSDKDIELMKKRAFEFAIDTTAYNRFYYEKPEPATIIGFRLLKVIPERYEEVN